MSKTHLTALLLLLSLNCWGVDQYTVQVLDRKPHPRDNFVQGLEIVNERLYVSSGNYGKSRLLRYRLEDMQLESGRKLHPKLFAEGLTVLDDTLFQLTWRKQMLLVYQLKDLAYQHWLRLPGEGWGLTNNGKQLIYSDGSDKLFFMQPEDAAIVRTLPVTLNDRPVHKLNELEWIDGAIWANIWQTDQIVIIDPASGNISATVDLTGLLPSSERRPDTGVLNGIARNPQDGALWVTGKHWPWLYRIELIPKHSNSPQGQ